MASLSLPLTMGRMASTSAWVMPRARGSLSLLVMVARALVEALLSPLPSVPGAGVLPWPLSWLEQAHRAKLSSAPVSSTAAVFFFINFRSFPYVCLAGGARPPTYLYNIYHFSIQFVTNF